MRYPKFLTPGGTIGLAAPSFGCAGPFEQSLNYAEQALGELGYSVKEGPNCRRSDGCGISASPAECGHELTDSYCDPESDVLISCGGGELMCRDLEFVDLDRVKAAEPKWFMGLSDNTNFTYLLTTACDVASIYGPCVGGFGTLPLHPALRDALDLLEGRLHPLHSYDGYQRTMFVESEDPRAPYAITEPLNLQIYPDQTADCSGRLLGGCVDVLVNLLGTEFDHTQEFLDRYEKDGVVWFLECCDLNIWSICRAMWQMKHAGWFRTARGFIIGRPLCNGQTEAGFDQYKAVTEILGELNVPVILDADLGHLPPSMPLITGSFAHVHAADGAMTVEMELRS